MVQNPILIFAVVLGILAFFTVYRRKGDIKDSIIGFIWIFLVFGTPFHFILVGFYCGGWVNRRVYGVWSNNWGSFIISLLGVPILFEVWQIALRLVIGGFVYGGDDAVGALVIGVGFATVFVVLILLGLVVYTLSSLVTSFKRRNVSSEETLVCENI